MELNEAPLLTTVYDSVTDFTPSVGSVYVASEGTEERSSHFADGRFSDKSELFCIASESVNEFYVGSGPEQSTSYRLRSKRQLSELWTKGKWKTAYLDITGLRHHTWIPLLRSALEHVENVRVVYVEPDQYKLNATPTEGQIFDLSERINGISPIPGFATFSRPKDEFVFIPLLGFEGTRVAYLLEDVQPVADKIVPVVGVPGFRPEHPFNTYLGNRIALLESNAWQRVRFADANCPFSLFYLLNDIAKENEGLHLKIAMVGTKPHALGAALFVMRNMLGRELVYDHPVTKSERTSGIGRLLEYDVGAFRGHA